MTDATPAPDDALAAVRARMADHIAAALACLGDIPDPVARERAARALGEELLPDAVKRTKAVRGGAVQELRAERGLKLREVAELLDLSVPRVDQLAKGK